MSCPMSAGCKPCVGMKLVPIVPAPEMVQALIHAVTHPQEGDDDVKTLVRALHEAIMAAPSVPLSGGAS